MKTIAITGAASGIGRATAMLFAHYGWLQRLVLRPIMMPKQKTAQTLHREAK
ncbi:MAG: hypothetical protein HZB24_11370 [Desulfobacterales bacterium]|nr:hypothetical protein [Desulfobacterales bacterium]